MKRALSLILLAVLAISLSGAIPAKAQSFSPRYGNIAVSCNPAFPDQWDLYPNWGANITITVSDLYGGYDGLFIDGLWNGETYTINGSGYYWGNVGFGFGVVNYGFSSPKDILVNYCVEVWNTNLSIIVELGADLTIDGKTIDSYSTISNNLTLSGETLVVIDGLGCGGGYYLMPFPSPLDVLLVAGFVITVCVWLAIPDKKEEKK